MKRITYVALGVVVVAVAAAVLVRATRPEPEPVRVVQWSNSHLMRPELLPKMAEEFNREGHTTPSGKPIEVEVVQYDSVDQIDDLESRVSGRGPRDRAVPDPTVVTPQAEHWLSVLNADAGRDVVDAVGSPSIARTVVGIVTYRDIAECLGWPDEPFGYADLIALRSDPAGWRKYPCWDPAWGPKPLVAFTNPRTSTTGRSVLISLYSMATGKAPEELTEADVQDPAVRAKVREFAGLVDHYYPGTIPLNTKVYQGPKFGQFFLMPEDNLIRLYEGHEKANINGQTVEAPPIDAPMVMMYPEEGATWHSHPAAVVDAQWVSGDERDAATEWIEYLRADDRQSRFMKAGFRPGTDLPLSAPISARFGADPKQPRTELRTNRTDPAVIRDVVDSWGDVKRPAVVTFVVDTSGSMNEGGRIDRAKSGLEQALKVMAAQNQVGLVGFADAVYTTIPPKPLGTVAVDLFDTVEGFRASGRTALYDAIAEGIRLSDSAAAPDDAIRAVVVLSDGLASCDLGKLRLDDLFEMRTRSEVPVASFDGTECDLTANDGKGSIRSADVVGVRSKLSTAHPVQVFFVGVGEADLDVGRIVAEATGAEYQGTPEADLAAVLGAVSDYF